MTLHDFTLTLSIGMTLRLVVCTYSGRNGQHVNDVEVSGVLTVVGMVSMLMTLRLAVYLQWSEWSAC